MYTISHSIQKKTSIHNKQNSMDTETKKIRLEKVFFFPSILNNWLNIYLWYFCVTVFGNDISMVRCQLNFSALLRYECVFLYEQQRKISKIKDKNEYWFLFTRNPWIYICIVSKWKVVFKFLNIITCSQYHIVSSNRNKK